MSIFQNLVHSWSITSAYLNVFFHLTVKVTAANSRREGAKLNGTGGRASCHWAVWSDWSPAPALAAWGRACSGHGPAPVVGPGRAGEPPCVSLLPPEGPSEDYPWAEPAGKEAGSRPQQLFYCISLYFLCKNFYLEWRITIYKLKKMINTIITKKPRKRIIFINEALNT